jgi:hypothetical protein
MFTHTCYMYNTALYTYINICVNMHLHLKLLYPLCSQSGCGPSWDRETAFIGPVSNARLHTGSSFPLTCD